MGGKGNSKQLTREVAAKRLCIEVTDLPDLGKPWTGRDVTDVQRSRPEWLRCARKALGAARAEEERQRKARVDVVLARRTGFEYPSVTAVAADFARDFAKTNLLAFLHDAVDTLAADTYRVTVVYTGQSGDESAESELVCDMLAVVTSFAGRLYGQRSAKTKRLRAAVSAETQSGDGA